MIEGEVRDGEPPIYQAALTEKKTQQKVYYSDSALRVQYLKTTGKRAFLTRIDFKAVKNSGEQPTYAFAFRDEKGTAVLWRFNPASDPTEQGAGLTPQTDAQGLLLLYRDIGTLAGQGSAVQIGDKLSEAAPWPEVSSPPYFVAFRGALAAGMHVGSLSPGEESWRLAAAPAALQEGAEWKFTTKSGTERQLRIISIKGDEMTISQTNDSGSLTGQVRMTVSKANADKALALQSLSVVDGKHFMKIDFKPALTLPSPGAQNPSSNSAETSFQIDEDGHRKVIEGKISVESDAGGARLVWKPQSPAWAKKHMLTTSLSFDADGYKISVK
ncbi:MAG TPA: hypothetical protein VLZ81_10115 [Blastocatellia bacterium]|nr:hypothetical protein [Blastocatellia bacterium]